MNQLTRWCLAACVALGACRDKPPPAPKLSEVMPRMMLPPGATFIRRSSGPDALQVVVGSPASADSVAAFYRRGLAQGGWHLVNDARDADGAVVLYAQQNGPPLWVRIRSADGGQGSIVELSGAVVPVKHDTAASAAPRKPAS